MDINIENVLAQHKLWLQGRRGQRADLSGANLRGANLRGANLSDADLSDANLRGANLRGANLGDADLSDANLSGADLSCADLSDANLRGANLSDADLRGANLSRADLSDAGLPTKEQLLAHLFAHTKTDQYNQFSWCGTNCCLAGAAGQLIDNQFLGVAVIMQVLPEFDLKALYQSDSNVAINELERVGAL